MDGDRVRTGGWSGGVLEVYFRHRGRYLEVSLPLTVRTVVDTMRQDGDYLVMGWWLETADVIHW